MISIIMVIITVIQIIITKVKNKLKQINNNNHHHHHHKQILYGAILTRLTALYIKKKENVHKNQHR